MCQNYLKILNKKIKEHINLRQMRHEHILSQGKSTVTSISFNFLDKGSNNFSMLQYG